ncbi:MAG: class I SAM-dependent methyltransferase [Candidatus Binatia bacterium]
MSLEDRQHWQHRHREPSPLSPRASVLELPRASSPRATALDLACGQGRHSAVLTAKGYLVVAMDVSRIALQRVLHPANDRAGLLAVEADADDWPFAASAFDLIVQVDFLDRRLFSAFRSSLKPEGLLLIDTFLDRGHRNAAGPSRPEFLLMPDELSSAFADFEILRYAEQGSDTARAEMLARKR